MATKTAVLPIRAVPEPQDPAAPLLAKMVDELGEIETRLAPHRTYIAREEALRKQIRAGADSPEKPADGEIRVPGTKFDVLLGPRSVERTIDFRVLVKRIGAAAFAKFARCGLGDLEKNAPGNELACVRSGNTGSRPLKVFAKAA